jgi:hypothetical protein
VVEKLFDQKSIKAVIFTILFLNQWLLLDYAIFLIVLFSKQRTLPLKLWLNNFLLVSIIISTIFDNTVVHIVSVDFRRWH